MKRFAVGMAKVASHCLKNDLSTKIHNIKPKVLVPIADGTEEIEAVTVIDVLTRAGADVTVASASDNLKVTCSRGVCLEANTTIDLSSGISKEWDLIVCPGGMSGASTLGQHEKLAELLRAQNLSNKLIGAICAAPAMVLAPQGILHGKHATCYPAVSFIDLMHDCKFSHENVVVDGNIITSRGPGTAMCFSLALVSKLFGPERRVEIANQMLYTEHLAQPR